MSAPLGDRGLGVGLFVLLEFEKSNKCDARKSSRGFLRWIDQTTADFVLGGDIDTSYSEGDVCVGVRREDGALILEYAKIETMRRLEKYARR